MAEAKLAFQTLLECIQDLSSALEGMDQDLKTLVKETFKFSPSSSKSISNISVPTAIESLDHQTFDSVTDYTRRLQEMLEVLNIAGSPLTSGRKLYRAVRMANYKAKLCRRMVQHLHDRKDSVAIMDSLHCILQFIENEKPQKLESGPSGSVILKQVAGKIAADPVSSKVIGKLVDYIQKEVNAALKTDDLNVDVKKFREKTKELQRNLESTNGALEKNIKQLDHVVDCLSDLCKIVKTSEQEAVQQLSDLREPTRQLEEACTAMNAKLLKAIASNTVMVQQCSK